MWSGWVQQERGQVGRLPPQALILFSGDHNDGRLSVTSHHLRALGKGTAYQFFDSPRRLFMG